MHGIIQKNVAGLQVTVNKFGLLLVQILHGLGYFKGPNDSVFERWKWHHSLPAPGPGPVQPLLQCGAEMLRDHPRAPGRVDARAHEMKHKPVTLGERFEFLLLIFLIKINKINIFHIKKNLCRCRDRVSSSWEKYATPFWFVRKKSSDMHFTATSNPRHVPL